MIIPPFSYLFLFPKRKKIVIVFLADKALPKWDLILKEKITPTGATSFPYKLTPIEKERKIQMAELLPVIYIHSS